MRVGSEALGGTPYDAAGPKGADATPGDATAAGVGFFALLALLQAGVAAGDAVAGGADGIAPDEGADAAAADGADTSAVSDGGDVVVTLSGAAAAAAAIAGAAGTTQPDGASAAVGDDGASSHAQPGTSGAAIAGSPGPVAPALADAASASAESVAAARTRSNGTAVPIAAEPAEGKGGPVATAGRVASPPPSESARETGPQRSVAADAASGAAAGAVQAPAAQAQSEPDARPGGQSTTTSAPELSQGRVDDAATDGDAAADDGAERRDGARDAFAAPRPAATASADRLAPGAGVEPAPAITSGEANPSSADLVPAARDTQRASDTSSRAASGAERAALADGGSLPGWIERLTNPQRLAAARRTNALRFDLEPAGLGRIEVRLSFGRDGVRAQVFAEHEHTRALIAQQQPQLAGAFERNDLRLESFLVDLGFGGEGSGEARREVEDPDAFARALSRTAPAEPEVAPTLIPTVTGLLSVRA